MLIDPNMLIAYSAKAGSTAADGDGTNSPFTTALSRHLTTPGLDVRRAFGFVRDDVLKTTVYVASDDRADLVRAWDVIAEAFGDARPPSTLLGVAMLGYAGQLVELEAVALRRG